MSYVTRAVMKPATTMENGIPKAFFRLAENLDFIHKSNTTISAPDEPRNGRKFQVSFFAVPNANLTIGRPGQPNSLAIQISEAEIQVSATGSNETRTFSAPWPSKGRGLLEVPLKHVYFVMYKHLRGFGIALALEGKEVFNNEWSGKNYWELDGQELIYSENIWAVQIFCNDKDLDSAGDSNEFPGAFHSHNFINRYNAAIFYNEIWEEWTFHHTTAPDNYETAWIVDTPTCEYYAPQGKMLDVTPVASSSPGICTENVNGVFNWEWPEGARRVRLWLSSGGDGGNGGKLTTGHPKRGRRGRQKAFQITHQTLTLRIGRGGAGGGKGDKPPAEPGQDSSVDEIPNSNTANGDPDIFANAGLTMGTSPRTQPWVGVQGDTSRWYLGRIAPGSLGELWRYVAGGRGGTNSLNVFDRTPGRPGYNGIALFHYQY